MCPKFPCTLYPIPQADLDSENQLHGPTNGPVEVIIKVNCVFNHPDETQLAVMVPIQRMKGGYEAQNAGHFECTKSVCEIQYADWFECIKGGCETWP